MAAYEDGSYSSESGIVLIGKVLAGRCGMHYTRAAVGKGTIPEGESPKTMTEPADYVMDAQIAAVTNPVDGECQVTVQINSNEVKHGFFCTCILLYAEDPDEGEVSFTYLVLEDGPEWIRPASSAVGKLATFDLIAAVGDVDKVTASIDPDSIMSYEAVQQLIKDHNEDPDAHKDLISDQVKEQVAEQVKEMEKSGDLVTPESVEKVVDKKTSAAISEIIIFSALPPEKGPALWFCTDKNWRPETEPVATAILGDPAEAEKADAIAEVNDTEYPILNATVAEEGGGVVATIRHS